MTDTLSTFRAKYLDRASVLRAVLDTQGAALFSKILEERALQAKPEKAEPRSYSDMWRRFRDSSITEHAMELREKIESAATVAIPAAAANLTEAVRGTFQRVQTSDDKSGEILGLLAGAASTYAGVFMGLNLPSVDVRFFSSDAPEQTVVFHSAPRLFAQVSLDWASRILGMAAESKSLTPDDRAFFQLLGRLFDGALSGVVVGTAVRDEIWKSLPGLRGLLHTEQPLPVDAQSLKLASYWVQEMLRRGK